MNGVDLRYSDLFLCCKSRKPKSIIEIGANNGYSAYNMIVNAGASRYVGFDLFEDASDETNAREMNAKKPAVMSEVLEALEDGTDASILLIKGDTNKTLPEFLKTGEKFDLAFIDGGHSIETIRNDWFYVRQMMNPDGVVIFDDYHHNKEGFGCNEIVKNLPFKPGRYISTTKKTGLKVSMVMVPMKELKGKECIGFL